MNTPLLQCHIERLDGSDEYEFDSPTDAPGLCQHHFESFLADVPEEVELASRKAPV